MGNAVFCKEVHKALSGRGFLIIRQFLQIKVKRIAPNGKEILLPEKNLYGIGLGEGGMYGFSAETLQECCEIDAQTGKRLPREEGVHYQALAIHNR